MKALKPSDVALLRTIGKCDVNRQVMATHFVLVVGLALGTFLLVMGLVDADLRQRYSGIAMFVIVPIIAAARYRILKLYRLVQALCSTLQELQPGSPD